MWYVVSLTGKERSLYWPRTKLQSTQSLLHWYQYPSTSIFSAMKDMLPTGSEYLGISFSHHKIMYCSKVEITQRKRTDTTLWFLPIIMLCLVTESSWITVWQNGTWYQSTYEAEVYQPMTFTRTCWTCIEFVSSIR